MAENPTDFIQKMLSTNTIQYKNYHLDLFGKTGVMLNMRLFVQLMKHFIDKEPVLLENTMYESIKFLVEEYEQRQGNLEGFVSMSENIIAATGLGFIQLDIGKTDAIARCEINPFAEEYVKFYGVNASPICYLTKGAIRLLFDEVFKTKGKIEEIECIGQGKQQCIFRYNTT